MPRVFHPKFDRKDDSHAQQTTNESSQETAR